MIFRLSILLHIQLATAVEFGWGSCAKQHLKPQHWAEVSRTLDSSASEEEKLPWVWLGDAAYRRGSDDVGDMHLEAQKQENVGYKAFAENREIFGTWDDHDFGLNDAIGAEDSSVSHRQEMMRDFLGSKFFSEGSGEFLRSGPGMSVWRKWKREPDSSQPGYEVHLVAFDLRSFNERVVTNPILRLLYSCSNVWKFTPFTNALARVAQFYLRRWVLNPLGFLLKAIFGVPEEVLRTNLGSFQSTIGKQESLKHGHGGPGLMGYEQWQWFEKEVLPAVFEGDEKSLLLIGSSVQVLSKNPVFEGWHHNDGERERLLNLLRPYQERVVFLSGDVHFAEANYDSEEGFAEVTSSGITHKVLHE